MKPFISICIPSYNRVEYLRQLLDSIVIQRFKDFNVIITDDSDNDEVNNLINAYSELFQIQYYRNIPALGPANNWNKAMQIADGEWIKLMHDDDCFASENSLFLFAETAKDKDGMIFCAFNVCDERQGAMTKMALSASNVTNIQKNPYIIFYNNVIGPPSVTMVHRNIKELYNAALKWFVDFEYYIRVINITTIHYIPEAAIQISYNYSQVTNSCFRKREVEIPESIFFIEKYGSKLTQTLGQYDKWWRLIRNLEIRDVSEFAEHAGGHEIPLFIIDIINFQKNVPLQILKKGFVSKPLMFLHYFLKFKMKS